MTRFGTALGAFALCAIVVSALSGTSASASAAYECVATSNPPSVQFKDAHCVTGFSGSSGFRHVWIPVNVLASVSISNANTASETTAARVSKLKGTVSGVETEVQCTTVSGTGSMENKEEGATTWAQGTGTLTYSGCTVAKPAGKGCVVGGGEVKTNKLFATTKGFTNQLKVTPNEGSEFAGVKIESCSVKALNNTFPVTGSIIVDLSGATPSSLHALTTPPNSFKLAGQNAGLDGAVTVCRTGPPCTAVSET